MDSELIIPAVTVYQPFASFLAYLAKLHETRGWATNYRGIIAIHAGKRWSKRMSNLTQDGTPYGCVMREFGIEHLHLGHVLAIAHLSNVMTSEQVLGEFLPDEKIPWFDRDVLSLAEIVENKDHKREMILGDYSRGSYSWVMSHATRFDEPIPATGFQRIWKWQVPADKIEVVNKAIDIVNSKRGNDADV